MDWFSRVMTIPSASLLLTITIAGTGMSQRSEREPLLREANQAALPPGAPAVPVLEAVKDVKVRHGPLDISRTNRYAILAGIWTATFLSVCYQDKHAQPLSSN